MPPGETQSLVSFNVFVVADESGDGAWISGLSLVPICLSLLMYEPVAELARRACRRTYAHMFIPQLASYLKPTQPSFPPCVIVCVCVFGKRWCACVGVCGGGGA